MSSQVSQNENISIIKNPKCWRHVTVWLSNIVKTFCTYICKIYPGLIRQSPTLSQEKLQCGYSSSIGVTVINIPVPVDDVYDGAASVHNTAVLQTVRCRCLDLAVVLSQVAEDQQDNFLVSWKEIYIQINLYKPNV